MAEKRNDDDGSRGVCDDEEMEFDSWQIVTSEDINGGQKYSDQLQILEQNISHQDGPGPDCGTKSSEDAGLKVEDTHTETAKTELKVDEITPENTTRASTDDKQNVSSEVKDDQIPLGIPPDQTTRGPLELGPRDVHCLTRILTSQDLHPLYPELFLSSIETSFLINAPEIVANPPNNLLKNLLVFDEDSTLYNMRLSQDSVGGSKVYFVSTDWKKFVKDHGLKAGNEIFFHRKLCDVSGGYYYILTTKSSDDAAPKVENTTGASTVDKQNGSSKVKDDQIPLGPRQSTRSPYLERGLREGHCLTKTLTSQDVHPLYPKLVLGSIEASVLINAPEIVKDPPFNLLENLLSFDENDTMYNMLLLQDTVGVPKFYLLTGDWKRFVEVHSLKAGDEIIFHRNLCYISTGFAPYYSLKYARKSSLAKDDVQDSKMPKVSAVVPSEKEPVLETKYKKASLENTPDEKKDNVPHCSRKFRRETFCLSKILNSTAVAQENGRLHMYDFEAKSLNVAPLETSKNLVVYDTDDMRYDMLLSHVVCNDGEIKYTLSAGWQSFVKYQQLKVGDEVLIFKFPDRHVCDDYHYVIKCVRELEGSISAIIRKRTEAFMLLEKRIQWLKDYPVPKLFGI